MQKLKFNNFVAKQTKKKYFTIYKNVSKHIINARRLSIASTNKFKTNINTSDAHTHPQINVNCKQKCFTHKNYYQTIVTKIGCKIAKKKFQNLQAKSMQTMHHCSNITYATALNIGATLKFQNDMKTRYINAPFHKQI